jgi:hypothetical protein
MYNITSYPWHTCKYSCKYSHGYRSNHSDARCSEVPYVLVASLHQTSTHSTVAHSHSTQHTAAHTSMLRTAAHSTPQHTTMHSPSQVLHCTAAQAGPGAPQGTAAALPAAAAAAAAGLEHRQRSQTTIHLGSVPHLLPQTPPHYHYSWTLRSYCSGRCRTAARCECCTAGHCCW